MGDLAVDTALSPSTNGSFTATLSRDWEIWGPNGGYMAAIALGAARETSGRARPANATVHFLGVASFDATVEVTTTVQRATRQATSVHVRIDQLGKAILAAMVWAVDTGIDGLEHGDAPAPSVPPWHELPTISDRMAADHDATPSRYAFWRNFEQRPTTWLGAEAWEQRRLGRAQYEEWLRFDSPPAADEWCLLQGTSPVARDGLIGSHQQVWNERGDLVASGISHLLCRRIG